MNDGMIKLLYIEDDVVDQMAFKRLVREKNLPYELTLANSVKNAREAITKYHFDIVISDFLLGDGTSFEYLPEIISTGTPVILVTGTGDEDVAVKAIKMGASDYVIKDIEYGHLKMLPLIVESSLRIKKSDDKLKKLSMAVEQSPSMLMITDSDGFIEYINPRVTEITGYILSDFSGTDLFHHHANHNPENTVSDITETVAKGLIWRGNTCHARKSGELFWEFSTISPIYDKENHLTGYIKVSEDITERRKSEEAIKKYAEELRESNASKDKMFSIIAHDLRTPFNGLLAFSDVLSTDYDSLSKEEVLEYIGDINDLSRNTFNLLEKLLQWSRLQTGRMEFMPVSLVLTETVGSVIGLLSANARGKRITLTADIDPGIRIFADPNMVNSVIRNITSNAIKFTPENGFVKISAVVLNENLVEISISDTGLGINPEDITKLFRVEHHLSTKGTGGESGSGLGLLLCMEFVERNGGSIRVESEPEKGSRFIFTLPLSDK